MQIKTTGLCLLLGLGLSTGVITTLTGCAGDQYNRSTGQYIDDKSLTVRVHDALHDNPDYKFDNVDVNIYRGTVQLSGWVDSTDQKSKAGDIVRGVQGVRDVQNNITVRGS